MSVGPSKLPLRNCADQRRTAIPWQRRSGSTSHSRRLPAGYRRRCPHRCVPLCPALAGISLGDLSLGVDPDDKIAARLGDGPVERRWREPRGVLTGVPSGHAPPTSTCAGVITRRPGGNDDVELELNVLGQERLQAAIDHLGCVTSGITTESDKGGVLRSAVTGQSASHTTMVSSMIMRSSTGDQLTTYCRS